MLSSKEIIGIRIKEIRKLKGLSGKELARLLLLSQQHVSRIERGLVLLNLDQIQNIADALSIDICMLLEGLGYENIKYEEGIDITLKKYNSFFHEIDYAG